MRVADIEIGEGRPAIASVRGVLTPADALEWLTEHRDTVHEVLLRFGSLLIRGLRILDTEGFAAVRDALLEQRVPYREKATPRSDFGKGVYSSTDMAADHPIRLHSENSYVLDFPGLLLFGCVTAPEEGGATTVGDNRELLARLDPAVAARFRERGWTLLRNFQPGISMDWTTAFNVDSREELEDYLRANLITWYWGPDGQLTTSQRRPAVVRHPVTDEEVWFNHVGFWNRYTLAPDVRDILLSSYGESGLPYDTAYGDGEPIPQSEIDHINEVYNAVRRRESYHPGDLLLVENVLSSHGREPYHGSRKVLVAMGTPRSLTGCRPAVAPAPGPLRG